jgi:methyltransferase (TIGR00027 family)
LTAKRKSFGAAGSGNHVRMAMRLPDGVSETAVGAAMMRARESARVDRLFDDPYAAAFLAAVPPIFEEGPTTADDPALAALEAAFEEEVVVRTRFYDDFVRAATANACLQVVLVGAGLDTRAFRLDWPSNLRLFELDLPHVLEFKERVLAQEGAKPRCARLTVGVDLQHDWPATLLAAGFISGDRAAWVIEGLIPYLAQEDADRLLIGVSRLSSPGSRLALDQPNVADDSALSQARAMPTMKQIAAMWKGGLGDNAALWLDQHGWQAETTESKGLGARYGRQRIGGSRSVFFTATRLH